MRNLSPALKTVPLDIVGSTKFGRYPKISTEQTINMITVDGFLVPYAGHKELFTLVENGQGRGIYASSKYNHIIVVVDDIVYSINSSLKKSQIANIDTFSGDIFIAENNAGQIAICDKLHIYIFNYLTNSFSKSPLDFSPSYIAFQNGLFIAGVNDQATWRLSEENNGLVWPADASHVGRFQTKSDKVVATIPVPGKSGLIFICGENVIEPWFDVGRKLFPYERSTYFNIDYGCLNPKTIAVSDKFVIWLGGNEKSGPVIMISEGGETKQISTDGINFKLSTLSAAKDSSGFLFKLDGHLFYQLTFVTDNLTFVYSFEQDEFYTMTDQFQNYHIAKSVVSFNNSYYFISFDDGNFYEMSSKYHTYNGDEIPRIRICKNIRTPDQSRFVINNMTFTIEQGQASTYLQAVDLSLSKDGGESFGNSVRKIMNPLGKRQNRMNFWNLGSGNDIVPQFRFWGDCRFVATNGVTSIYQ